MNKDKIIKITGAIEVVRYYKDGWGIIECSVESSKNKDIKIGSYIIFKGEMPTPIIGNIYRITGEYAPDDRWGDQYKIVNISAAVSFDTSDEVNKKRFLTFLFTDTQVQAMYKALSDPFNILLEKNAKELVKVKGIQMKTAVRMITKFQNNLAKAKIFTDLEDYNLTNTMVDKLLNKYKSPELVIEKVQKNPYVLITEVNGIGWKRADQIALSGGLDPTDPKRIEAFAYHYMDERGEEGFSWITCDELLGAILDILGEEIPDTVITEAIHNLEDKLWWNEEKTKIGLKKYRNIEEKVAQELLRLRNATSNFKVENWQQQINELEKEQGWEFNEQQIKAIQAGIENNVCMIYGKAGCGKTTSINGIIKVLKDYSFVQCSLSGRAASRMSEITGAEGYTIHRLLGYPKGESIHQQFVFHKHNKLWYNIYIIDEISMLNIRLFYYLLRAIPDGSKLIMMGDDGQLESIGEGNIAYDVINSPEILSIQLTKIHRQAQKSGIITEALAIRSGKQIVDKDWVGQEVRGEIKDFYLKCFSDSSNTFIEIIKQFNLLMHESDFSVLNTQVIIPVKKRGGANTYNLNNAIQDIYNPLEKQNQVTIMSDQKYYLREGDKIINTQNNYKLKTPIYNGSIGIIKQIYKSIDDKEYMIISFQGIGDVEIPKNSWSGIELGYAITVHKAQGSQWSNVIFGLDNSAYTLLSRELIYTGITRAEKRIYFLAQTVALRIGTGKESISQKQTHLQNCLDEVAHPKLIF